MLAAACSLVTPLDDLGGGGDATSEIAPLEASACDADTNADPHNCGACGHDCCGGACTAGQCQPLVLASQQVKPAWVIADATHVYWEVNTTSFQGSVPPTDVMRVGTDGSNLEVFASQRAIFNGIQTDGTRIIWLEASVAPPAPFRVAWADKTATVGDAGAPVQVVPAMDPNASSASMRGFYVDTATMYWFGNSSTECPNFSACVFFAPTSNLGARTVVQVTTSPYNIALGSADTDYIYPWTQNGSIARLSKKLVDGGLPSDIVETTADGGVSITAVDETTLYFSNTAAGTIYAMPKVPDAGAPQVFATLQNVPRTLAATQGQVYWANSDGIVSCPASGCPNGPDKPRVIVAENGITDFAITPSCFFYANPQNGTIKVVGR
jgi:sugar lactone lactonase YvrE